MGRTWACINLGDSMNNLLSYCGLIDANIRASDKDLPVSMIPFYIVAGGQKQEKIVDNLRLNY